MEALGIVPMDYALGEYLMVLNMKFVFQFNTN